MRWRTPRGPSADVTNQRYNSSIAEAARPSRPSTAGWSPARPVNIALTVVNTSCPGSKSGSDTSRAGRGRREPVGTDQLDLVRVAEVDHAGQTQPAEGFDVVLRKPVQCVRPVEHAPAYPPAANGEISAEVAGVRRVRQPERAVVHPTSVRDASPAPAVRILDRVEPGRERSPSDYRRVQGRP